LDIFDIRELNNFLSSLKHQNCDADKLISAMTMAPIKRKGNAPDNAAAAHHPKKRARVANGSSKEDFKKESKPARTSTDEQSHRSKAASGTATKPAEVSVLREEEPSFPRGGGDILTPLERKQIQNQATRDVLFEQKGSGKAADGYDDDDDDEDMGFRDADEPASSTKKVRKGKGKNKKHADQEAPAKDKDGVRVEGLSFKVSRS
jgi:rRNA biogenesis protein RRP5